MDIDFQFEPIKIKRNRKKLIGSLEGIKTLDVLTVVEINDLDTIEKMLPQLQVAFINQQLYQQCDELTIQKYLLMINLAIQYFQHTQEEQNKILKDLKRQEQEFLEQELKLKFKVKNRKTQIKELIIENENEKCVLEKEKFSQEKKKNKFSCYFCPDKFFDFEQMLDNHILEIHEKQLPHPYKDEAILLSQQAQFIENEINQIILQNQQQIGFYQTQ